MVEIISILSGLCFLALYPFYIVQMKRGESTPNPATWFIWWIVSIGNAYTYLYITHDNPWKASIALVAPFAILVTLIFAVYYSKFTKFKCIEWIIVTLTIVFAVVWYYTNDERLANGLIQIILIISFIPTIEDLVKKEAKERPVPWLFAVIAYSLSTFVVLFEYTDWLQVLYPVGNGIIGNGIILILSIRSKK